MRAGRGTEKNLLNVLKLATTSPGLGHVVTQHTFNVITAEGRLAEYNKLESVLGNKGDVLAGVAVTVGGVHFEWFVWFPVCAHLSSLLVELKDGKS